MQIVLLEPEIPSNTGNIGRTCAAANTPLHLIRPYGFTIDDKALKRAGMDYWPHIELYEYDNFDEFLLKNPDTPIYMTCAKAQKNYADVRYQPGDFIMFGKESAGIPEALLLRYRETAIRIPMGAAHRSLNLANAAAVVLYEALRQNGFAGLQVEGQLHHYKW